ncbi:hypothetical protein, partial [Labrenzia sp. 011]|uniref:hypothetical protein n=1 Tax=Labrenzia sp. 011 TaxID=2171494 RepID=UPI00105719E9
MRSSILFIIPVLFYMVVPDAGRANSICEEAFQNIKGVSDVPKLFFRRMRSTGPEWLEIGKRGQIVLPQADSLILAMIANRERSGRSVLKVGVQPEMIRSARNVELRKNDLPGTCENRRRGFVGRLLTALSGGEGGMFANGASVRVKEYQAYHLQDKANDNAVLYRFHDSVENADGKCVATDDAESGNRREFLFSSPAERRVKARNLRIASLLNSVGPSSAEAAPPKSRGADPKSYGAHNFDKLYVHMLAVEPRRSDKDAEFACKSVKVPFLVKGDDVVVQFNRLTFRNTHKKR